MQSKQYHLGNVASWIDIRGYIAALERAGLFRWVTKEVDKDWEIACIARLVFRGIPERDRYAVGFSNIRGYPGMNIAIGLIGGSKQILAQILGSEPELSAIHLKWSKAMADPIQPRVVNTGACKENIVKDDDLDLRRFPVPIWIPEKDAGPYLTPLWVTKDINMEVRNVGVYRSQLKGKDKLGIQWGTPSSQHAAQHLEQWERVGRPMPAALVVGCDPAVCLPAMAKIPYGLDEFSVAGGVKGEPIELIKCETVDLEVPATAEIVIEGEFLPGVREPEGPFGEFTGYMASGSSTGEPVFKVKCITFRSNPVVQGIMSQMPPSESSCSRRLLMEGAILNYLRLDLKLPGISDVHLPESGGGAAWLWVSIKKTYKSQPLQTAMAVWSKFGFQHFKWIVVTDDDINIRSAFAREWTLAFRVSPQDDLLITPRLVAMTLDPSATDDPTIASQNRTASKIFIDATKKYGGFPEIALPSSSYLAAVAAKWDDYGLGKLTGDWKTL